MKMIRQATVIMYHFVRNLKQSRYPEIKGITIDEFKGQIGYIKKWYTPIRMEDLIQAINSKDFPLPHRPILLTFDDGYIDHYANVFPILDETGIQGSFFLPVKAICEHQVLDVNKIHYILASVKNKSKINEYIFKQITTNKEKFLLKSPDYYYKRLAAANRYDTAEVIFTKRVLQRELPEALRSEIIDNLFQRFVTKDEKAFATELYMSVDQLSCMRRNGMYLGIHGYDHLWLDTLNAKDQEKEVDKSLCFLTTLGCDTAEWAMCYPYGGYNDSLVSILARKGCKLGLTTNVGIADLLSENHLLLSRLDTNDLPKKDNAEPNEWTIQALHRNLP